MSVVVRPKVTIREVALASGVARSTVSKALAGKAYVRPETKIRVIEAARRLGYRASSLARGLRLQQTWSVGLLLADVSNPFFPDIVRGIEDLLWSREFNLIVCNTDYRKDKEAAYLQHLLDRQLDGLILASTASDSDEVLRLQEQGTPFVMLNRRHKSVSTDYVGMDNEGGVRATIAHLHGLGHRRIGFIKGRADSSAAEERLQGYRAAMRAFGLAVEDRHVTQGDYSIESGREAAAHFLRAGELPTAIVSANDFMAFGAMGMFAGAGIAVPDRISITGFDDIFVSALPEIDLTTVRPNSRQLGASAAELLLERIASVGATGIEAGGIETDRPRDIIVPTELIVRGTTARVQQ
jgi:LacI family transcriptional regulator